MTGLVDNFLRDTLSLTMNYGARENGTILGTFMVDWAVLGGPLGSGRVPSPIPARHGAG